MIRWTMWLMLLAVWTVALEVPVPSGGQVIQTYRYLIAKGMHVFVYAVLTFTAGWLRVPERFRWLVMFCLMVHAAATELLQQALEQWCHRSGSLADVGYDQIGIAIGVVLGWKWWTQADSK